MRFLAKQEVWSCVRRCRFWDFSPDGKLITAHSPFFQVFADSLVYRTYCMFDDIVRPLLNVPPALPSNPTEERKTLEQMRLKGET